MTSETSLEYNEELHKEFLEYCENKYPNPDQNPKQFEFLLKSFKFHKTRFKNEVV